MTFPARKTSWFVSGLLLVILLSAGFEFVVAQPERDTSRPVFDTDQATFESLGNHYLVNMNNIAYTSDREGVFDIYFACSAAHAPSPLRLTDAKDIANARAYFNDEKLYGKYFIKLNNYCINLHHIAYIEKMGNSIVVNFNVRIWNSFSQLALQGADMEEFRRKRLAF